MGKHYDEFVEEELNMSDMTVIDLREGVTFEQAKREIKGFFEAHHGIKFNSVDIAAALRIDDNLVTCTLDELEKDGQIAEVH
jgi:DNA-binding MarR family transcriptional regulator